MFDHHLLLDFLLGALIGGLGGLFGVGGGIIAIPVLALAFGYPQQLAQGTAMVMVVPNVLLGLWHYHRLQNIDMRMAATLAASALLFTAPAALLATRADSGALRLAFAIFLFGLSLLVFRRLTLAEDNFPARPALARKWAGVVGAFSGGMSGFFGVGGAMVAPPILTAYFGVNQMQAQGLALALVAPGTLVALATYATASQVQWQTGLALAVGGITSVPLGVAAAHRLPEKKLRLLFCLLLALTAVVLALER